MNINEFNDKLPQTSNKVISILSGGLDSTILTYALVNKYGNNNVIALTFNYNQRHNIELEKAKITCEKLNIKQHLIDLSFFGDIVKDSTSLIKNSSMKVQDVIETLGLPQSNQYVPNRNMMMLSIAVAVAEANNASKVFYGAQSFDTIGFWDCSQQFLNAINNVILLNREHSIEIVAPFIGLNKTNEILLGQELNVPFEDTWTCYNPTDDNKACKKCSSCSERLDAFKKANITDPINYKE